MRLWLSQQIATEWPLESNCEAIMWNSEKVSLLYWNRLYVWVNTASTYQSALVESSMILASPLSSLQLVKSAVAASHPATAPTPIVTDPPDHRRAFRLLRLPSQPSS